MLPRSLEGKSVLGQKADERLTELYWLHAPGALRLAFLMTGDGDAAEDIVQDAFVRAFGRFHDIRNREAFGAYLRRIVVNLSHDRFRRLKREREALQPPDEPLGVDLEERQLLRDVMRTLPHRQQAALVLRYVEDLTEQQTADVLGCSVAAVKSLVKRAKETMRKRLERIGDERR